MGKDAFTEIRHGSLEEAGKAWDRLTRENADLKARVERYGKALMFIAKDYIVDPNQDCPGCSMGPLQDDDHLEECVYLIAKEALLGPPMRKRRDSNVYV